MKAAPRKSRSLQTIGKNVNIVIEGAVATKKTMIKIQHQLSSNEIVSKSSKKIKRMMLMIKITKQTNNNYNNTPPVYVSLFGRSHLIRIIMILFIMMMLNYMADVCNIGEIALLCPILNL